MCAPTKLPRLFYDESVFLGCVPWGDCLSNAPVGLCHACLYDFPATVIHMSMWPILLSQMWRFCVCTCMSVWRTSLCDAAVLMWRLAVECRIGSCAQTWGEDCHLVTNWLCYNCFSCCCCFSPCWYRYCCFWHLSFLLLPLLFLLFAENKPRVVNFKCLSRSEMGRGRSYISKTQYFFYPLKKENL